jgi:hypothetical protein
VRELVACGNATSNANACASSDVVGFPLATVVAHAAKWNTVLVKLWRQPDSKQFPVVAGQGI